MEQVATVTLHLLPPLKETMALLQTLSLPAFLVVAVAAQVLLLLLRHQAAPAGQAALVRPRLFLAVQ
jgi:hypothetical protein